MSRRWTRSVCSRASVKLEKIAAPSAKRTDE